MVGIKADFKIFIALFVLLHFLAGTALTPTFICLHLLVSR